MIERKLHEIQTVEQLIEQYKINKANIKQLEQYNELVKKQLLEHYLDESGIVKNSSGLTLATYKPSIRTVFQTKKFESENKELHEKYLDLIEVKTFLVK
jgi:hypothetical protein